MVRRNLGIFFLEKMTATLTNSIMLRNLVMKIDRRAVNKGLRGVKANAYVDIF
jgi:hypothetical protein